MRRNWLYKKLASIKTSVWLLGILSGFYFLGTIFPQGKSYAESGGALLWLLKFIDVLHIFTAPLFLITAALLFINQLICAYERLRILMQKATSTINKEILREDPRTVSIPLPPQESDHDGAIMKALTGLGFRPGKVNPLNSNYALSLEKGVNPYWPSWIFHVAILILLAGFAVSYLFAFEGELSLLPGQIEEVSTSSSKSRWNRLQGKEVEPGQGRTFKIELREFITEYTQYPRLSYPPKGVGRLALFADIRGERVAYNLPEDSLFPKDWMSRLVVFENGREVKRKTIEVNDPLRHRGITFYQMDINQKLTLALGDAGEPMVVESGETFEVPGIAGRLQTGMLRVGTLYKKGGGREQITPFVKLKLIEKGETGQESKRDVGKLIQGQPLDVQGVSLTLKNWQEASVLSYRYDPGRPILWVASFVLLAAMSFRIWAYWYRIEYLVTGSDDNRKLYLRVMHNGLLADNERIIERIRNALMIS